MEKVLYCLTIVNSMPSDLSMNTCLRGFYMKEVSFAFLRVCKCITINDI